MESRTIQLTEAAHKYGNLNICSCGKEFFPPDVFGGSSKKEGLGIPITLRVDGFSGPIQTDIPTDKKTKHPRWMFRERAWVKSFLSLNNLAEGDSIIISRIGKRTYDIKANNDNQKLKQLEQTNETKGFYYKTKFGKIYLGDSLKILKKFVTPSSVDLIVTSPPFGLVRKKDYGNVDSDKYAIWFKPFQTFLQ